MKCETETASENSLTIKTTNSIVDSSYKLDITKMFGQTTSISKSISSTTAKLSVNDSSCVDFNESCEKWSKSGECKRNFQFMNVECKKSCQTCNQIFTQSSKKKITNSIDLTSNENSFFWFFFNSGKT